MRGALRMATEAATVERLKNGQPCEVDPIMAVLIVPPLPVTSEIFLADVINSPRERFETYVFSADDGNWTQLPDIKSGDRMVWDSQETTYNIVGIERWTRQSSSPFDGGSYFHFLIEETMIDATR